MFRPARAGGARRRGVYAFDMPRRVRQIDVAVDLWVVCLMVGLASLLSGCGDKASDARAPTPVPDMTDDALADALRRAGEFRGYRLYFAGSSVGGLRLTAVVRSTEKRTRYPSFLFVYGKCTPPRDPKTGLADGGCGPPVEIRNEALCASPPPRNARPNGRVRDVPASVNGDYAALDTERTSIAIFTSGPNTASIAAALRSLDGRVPRDGTLPPAAASGRRGARRC
jgi:hypothetical protein